MLEGDDLVAGVGVGLDVKFGDDVAEPVVQTGITDEHDLIGTIVGAEGGGGAELALEGGAQGGIELVDEIGGLGELEGVEAGRETGHGRAIKLAEQELDPLERADLVRYQGGIGLVEKEGAAELGVEQG